MTDIVEDEMMVSPHAQTPQTSTTSKSRKDSIASPTKMKTRGKTSNMEHEVLEALFENAPCAMIVSEPENHQHIIKANKKFRDLTGYSEKEYEGKNCSFLQILPNSKEKRDPNCISPSKQIKESLEKHLACEVLMPNYKKDGTYMLNQLSIKPVFRDEEGREEELLCYVATIKDVTIRQRIKKIVRTVVIGGLILFVGYLGWMKTHEKK